MTKKEIMLLQSKIAERAEDMGLLQSDRLNLLIDLDATLIAFDLDLERLFAADNFNFAHDICGIQNHIDRKASCMYSNPPKVIFKDCFVPRFAKI